MANKLVVWFEEVDKDDIGLVGGKGANLGEMTIAQLPIPYGFIVTAKAYFYFLKENNLEKKIKQILSLINYDNPLELQQASIHLKKLITDSPIPPIINHSVIDYYESLLQKEERYFSKKGGQLKTAIYKIKNLYKQPLVAVRSSATAEDLPSASFAGQQESFLNVRGESSLLKKIRDCWASLFTERAIYYRHQNKFDNSRVGLAAVVQRMVESEKSGVAFSIDPVTNDKNKIVIEAVFGLGEYIVQGKVTPDHYEIDKHSFVHLKKDIKYQNCKLVKVGNHNKEIRLSKTQGDRRKLTDEEIDKIAFLVKDIENHYYFPQDIEWAIEKNKIYIVQSRPITTIKNANNQLPGKFTISHQQLPILSGSPASPGIGIGPAQIIYSPKEINKINKGDVLVAPQTNPDYVPAMKKAAAIITEKGGRTSHAAIVSRELGIPAVVGAEKATKILKNSQIVSVNGSNGEVYRGAVFSSPNPKPSSNRIKPLKTLTKVYVNLAEPELAMEIAKRDVDGIGLLRAEFMIAEIGTHPKVFIKNHQEKHFIEKLTNNLLKFVKPFSPRQVVYRATDFKSNEYRHLKGGAAFEPKEENPMIGFRGASRYIANPDVFLLELEAVKNIWQIGYENLQLMIPFVRLPWEMVKIKQLIEKSGLMANKKFKLWIMVEVPSCALNLEDFLKLGINGVSIGTNDLTMMLLGVDRDNQEVSSIYDERSPFIISVLEYIVKTCAKYNVTCSICGQAASDYPEIIEKLIESGITSVSVNPDAIERTRQLIYQLENKHYQKIVKK